MFQPVIKWSGSKRSQCENIIKYFPKEIDTYYEPFCGGASVCRALMESKDHKVNKFVCSDLNRDLINLWNAVKNRPKEVADYYKILWTEMNKNDDKGIKRDYFENVRERYFDKFDNQELFVWMKTIPCGYAFSYDGTSGNENHTYDVPTDLYNEHVYIKSGNSSFKRIKEVAKDAVVYESLYLKEKQEDNDGQS